VLFRSVMERNNDSVSESFSSGYSVPFNFLQLDFDYRESSFIELDAGSKVYSLYLKYIADNLVENDSKSASGIGSFSVSEKRSKSKSSGKKVDAMRTELNIGVGLFAFTDKRSGQLFRALHQIKGDPVGSDCGAVVFKSLIIFVVQPNSQNILQEFSSFLIEESEATEKGLFTVFTWHLKYQYWKTESQCKARSLESVILPVAMKDKLAKDIEGFLSDASREFFERHGIPYKRSYLFYGVPGSGKTSLIQALAGAYERNICYLQPTHPDMTDDSIRCAVKEAPDDAIIVLEDIDALFGKDRSKKTDRSSLTFSGLLNALDGVGSPNGQIFILTTNLRDQLDSALIRNGRVDLHFHFDFASDEQIRAMWNSFYPRVDGEGDASEAFCSAVRAAVGGRPVTCAGLQHFFVMQRESSAVEALQRAAHILDDLLEKEVQLAEQPAKENTQIRRKKKTGKSKSEDDESDSDGEHDGMVINFRIPMSVAAFLGVSACMAAALLKKA